MSEVAYRDISNPFKAQSLAINPQGLIPVLPSQFAYCTALLEMQFSKRPTAHSLLAGSRI